mmetsp:Transcript_26433/g.84728  ORF Transcript_26433/g.84728 Transcript_26433/m.84728 type:complete len:464 (+) Transcript_26433:162-1553(+)
MDTAGRGGRHSAHDVGMLEAEQQMWVANQKRDLLELRHRQILARVDWLNQLNTQAMLVAGSAVASLGGESLETIADEDVTVTLLDTIFVASTAATLCFSLWVIFISSNLIMLSQMTALTGTSAGDVKTADEILERRINEVRSYYLLSLVMLLTSALSMVWMNCTGSNSTIATVIFVTVSLHAVRTLRDTSAEFKESTTFEGDDTVLQCLNSAAQLLRPPCCAKLTLRRWHRLVDRDGRSAHFQLPTDAGRAADAQRSRSRGSNSSRAAPEGRWAGGEARARAAAAPARYQGWVFKSKSHDGPLRAKERPNAIDHLRAALASEPSGRDLLAAAEEPRKAQPYPQPSGPLRDRRWFVLRDTALAWYNTDDDHTLQAPPKVMLSMSGYTVRETVEPGPARRSALMLLPRAVLAQPTEAPERAALAPKSWYIRAETDDETQRWLELLTVAIHRADQQQAAMAGPRER